MSAKFPENPSPFKYKFKPALRDFDTEREKYLAQMAVLLEFDTQAKPSQTYFWPRDGFRAELKKNV